MSNQNTYKHGEWNVYCDVCGFKKKSGDVRKRWDGLYVCEEDWEPRHPMDLFRGQKDDPSTPFQRPDDRGQQADNANTDINGETFPDTSDPNNTKTPVPPGDNHGDL